ncbi:MAG: hypothetical protein M3001_11695 [Staphylococcus epidermidis]|nr:hypothetical protein [Staphylococcus epidermidis]
MKNSEMIMKQIKYVIDHSDIFSLYVLEKDFGIDKKSMSQIRNGKRSVERLQLQTVLKLINAYEKKSK